MSVEVAGNERTKCFSPSFIRSKLLFITLWPVLVATGKPRLMSRILCIFELMKILSLGSTSFIEEQHQTSYFLFLTSVILISLCMLATPGNKTGGVFATLTFLGLFRLFRGWNQTGDKWAHLQVTR